MRIGSLFSGIGGLELGLERALGASVAWQVERDAYCRHVLGRHWPDVPRFDDVRTVGAHNLPPVDLLCGGFPCQDLSAAGKRAGFGSDDTPTRSGLWFEMLRIIDELRPTWVVGENIAHRWRAWVPVVRGALWQLGYASVPIRVRAADVGARHERARVFVVAGPAADVACIGRGAWRSGRFGDATGWAEHSDGAAADAHGDQVRVQRRPADGWASASESGADAPHDARLGLAVGEHLDGDAGEQRATAAGGADGCVSPGFGLAPRPWMVRGVHGLPGGVDGPWRRAGWTGARLRIARIHGLGNAVVPACAEVIGRLIASVIATRAAA